jgi:hypothetical protein
MIPASGHGAGERISDDPSLAYWQGSGFGVIENSVLKGEQTWELKRAERNQ